VSAVIGKTSYWIVCDRGQFRSRFTLCKKTLSHAECMSALYALSRYQKPRQYRTSCAASARSEDLKLPLWALSRRSLLIAWTTALPLFSFWISCWC